MSKKKTTAAEMLKVWVVEDSAIFATGVERIINRFDGMMCSGNFRSVEEAFEAMDQNDVPDVILLDVQLPGMDGISAISVFRKDIADTPILILTVFDDADKIFSAVSAGASGYILKSSTSMQIGEAIRQVVDGGSPMTPEVARKVLDAFASLDANSDDHHDYHLTPRELDILKLMADGLVKKEIADTLKISINTVSTHMRRVYEKLHVTTNTGAVAKALRERLI